MSDLRREDFERIDRLFSDALERSEEERDRFLQESGAPDEVVARVRRLLAAEGKVDERFGESAAILAGELFEGSSAAPADLAPGATVGPYRIVREIGRGGMGTVYLAERSDERLGREVAIKVIKRGMDTDEVVSRLRREARILARLEHPGIARLYDADVTSDGRPYLVLESVDGLPIDVFCDRNRLTVGERVDLFLRVCDAVSFAHTKLVLHRDLKPSNILVTEDGPRLIDFGIGKVLDDDGETRDLTALVGARLTPVYASPEQRSGEAVSTASDVYSLGVVLHELLTGCRPDGTGRPPSATVTRSADEDTTREAADALNSTPERLARRLRGDLDVILMKALHDDVERRYASVEALAGDLRRHVTGMPVSARPDSVTYRAHKFVSRNRLPVMSGSGLGLSVLIFGIASFVQQAETVRERDRAEAERVRAEGVAAVLEEMFTGAGFESTDRIDTMSVRSFLDRNAERVLADLGDQPAVQGTLLRIFGSAQVAIGRLESADSLLTRSISVLESTDEADPRAVLIASRDLGNLRIRQGRWDEARALYGRWFSSGVELDSLEMATALNNVGLALVYMGHVDSAAAMLDTALAIHRSRPDLGPVDFGSTLSTRAGVAQRAGDLTLAVTLSAEAVEVMTGELGAGHSRLFPLEYNRALMLFRSGRAREAEPLFADLLLRYRSEIGMSAELSTLLQGYGNLLRELGRPDEALVLIQEAVTLNRTVLPVGSPMMTFTLDALGSTLQALGRHAEALEAFDEQLRISESALGDGHPGTAVARVKVASARCRLEEVDASDVTERFRVADRSIRAAFSEGHPAVTDLWLRRGRCYLDIGRAEEATADLERALAGLEARGASPGAVETARDLLSRARAGGS